MSESEVKTTAQSEGSPSSHKRDNSFEEKVGMARKFDKEMKDYAKATVKEFLGIYGYEEDVDINMDDSGEASRVTETANTDAVEPATASPDVSQLSSQSSKKPVSSTAEKTSACNVVSGSSEQPAASVTISSSTSSGNADMTRFCITMSIPRNGADSEHGFTTLRFWNCIMCSTPFVGCKPEIVQRIHHPHLFTYQPEWLSHAGICTRCQNTLSMRSPKITIYAINEAPQYHHSYSGPPVSVPVAGQMCNAPPGQCNCAVGAHGHVPEVVPMYYTVTAPRDDNPMGTNDAVVNIKTEAVPACTEAGIASPVVTHAPKQPRPPKRLSDDAADRADWSPDPLPEGEPAEDSAEDRNVFDDSHDSPAPCRWCKKINRLQDFTYVSDNTKVVYQGLCSAACFESVKRIRQGKNVGYMGHDNPVSTFSWDNYLAETHSIAAPWICFKQSSAPPVNGFQAGMKLEAADPRNDGTVCVATVVGVIGSRLRLRFDGCDNANDIWRMVDSGDIHPIGWCEGNGGVLQPPVGFRWDVGKFSNFLSKTLANGELAPLRLFKKEPHSPKHNFFSPGHKLEAVDLKNPVFICVATVVEVSREHIKIVFDGWNATTKYTYRYDSRDIFPVGWCYFSGHPLQPPGPEYIKARKSSSEKHQMFSPAVRALDAPGRSSNPQQSRASLSLATADSASDKTPDHPFSRGGRVFFKVVLYVNHGCNCGSYLDPAKVAELPREFRGRVREVLHDSIQAIVDAALNPRTVLGFLQPGKGKVVIKARYGQDTYTCCLQTVDRVSIFWNVINRFCDNLRCCKNLFSNIKIHDTCPKCLKQGGSMMTKRKRDMAMTGTNRKDIGVELVERSGMVLKSRRASIREGPHDREEGGILMVKRRREMSGSGVNRRDIGIEVVERSELPQKSTRVSREEQDEREEAVGSTSSPTTWSTEEVVKYFRSSEIAQYAEVFKDHEIDGGALLLLNRETIMSCMHFKLGPALKLLHIIDQLKRKHGIL